MNITLMQNLKLATSFTTIISIIIKLFALRRLFEAIKTQRAERETAAGAGL